MTDNNDVLTLLREEVASVRMSVPADAIMARGRAVQRLRRSRVLAGALAVALGAGLSIPVLSSGDAANTGTLAAWTVTRQQDGSVVLTIRELRDLPALQERLNAAGARVTVGAGPGLEETPRACLAQPGYPPNWPSAVAFLTLPHNVYQVVIKPTLIPRHEMVRMVMTWGGAPGVAGGPSLPGIFATLVHDTAQCMI